MQNTQINASTPNENETYSAQMNATLVVVID